MAEARRFRRTAFATALALPLIALPLAAHHGWSNYGSEEFSITGAVETPVSLAGPHATMRIRADGQVWNIVLSAGNRVAAAGLKEGMIPLGAQVTAEGHRHRDAKVYEVKTERLKWNGRTFNVYPDRS
ncbi:MAG TPA: DUF6152 family protein [Vicinamibacterales bacterium]|jgi:hypothetical protein|nr:DUF6152 family protein [Vicinamibacterales bacterium]